MSGAARCSSSPGCMPPVRKAGRREWTDYHCARTTGAVVMGVMVQGGGQGAENLSKSSPQLREKESHLSGQRRPRRRRASHSGRGCGDARGCSPGASPGPRRPSPPTITCRSLLRDELGRGGGYRCVENVGWGGGGGAAPISETMGLE